MKQNSIFEWWRSTRGTGCYHERRGSNIVTTSQRYSRARSAKRAATNHARRTGGKVREIAAPRRR